MNFHSVNFGRQKPTLCTTSSLNRKPKDKRVKCYLSIVGHREWNWRLDVCKTSVNINNEELSAKYHPEPVQFTPCQYVEGLIRGPQILSNLRCFYSKASY